MITDIDFTLDSTRMSFYYDIFKYKISIHLPGIQYFRYCRDNDIGRLYNYEYEYLECHSEGIEKTLNNSRLMSDIFKFVKWRNSIVDKSKLKVLICRDKIIVYSIDIDNINNLLNKIDKKKKINYELRYVNSSANYDKGIIYQKLPKRKFRIYMKSDRYSTEERYKLHSFFTSNDITMSRSLCNWTSNNYNSRFNTWYSRSDHWAWDYYFFDFDDESLITLVSLKFDNLIRKVCRIEKR